MNIWLCNWSAWIETTKTPMITRYLHMYEHFYFELKYHSTVWSSMKSKKVTRFLLQLMNVIGIWESCLLILLKFTFASTIKVKKCLNRGEREGERERERERQADREREKLRRNRHLTRKVNCAVNEKWRDYFIQ